METTCPGARLAGSAMRRRLPAAILRRSVAGLLLALGLSRCAANKATPPVAVAQDGGDAGASWICDNACTLADDGPKVRFAAATELSGIAASALHEGVYYVHNDSGDEPRFFAIDDTGALRGTFRMPSAKAVDWEDVAAGPCAEGSAERCLFFGDFGDNDAKRTDYVVYRAREPATLDGTTTDVAAERIPFRYPDGSHDCETMLVHPTTGRLTVVTKERNGLSGVYSFPPGLAAGKTASLTRAGTLKELAGSPLVTAGDVHPEGRGVLLRTYSSLHYFAGAPGQSVEEMLTAAPCAVTVATEAQGESVAWLRSGNGYVTLSEGAATLHATRCGR